MNAQRKRFSLAVSLYLTLFLLLLAFTPLGLTAKVNGAAEVRAFWVVSLLWPILIGGLLAYANWRCSSEQMSYRDGLLWVTASMMTGWLYMSFILVLPALLLAVSGSVLIALYGDVRRIPGFARAKWPRMVHYFYRNRMRQK